MPFEHLLMDCPYDNYTTNQKSPLYIATATSILSRWGIGGDLYTNK